MARTYPAYDSIGLEIEATFPFRGNRIPDSIANYFRQEHDASIETPVFFNRQEGIFTTERTEDSEFQDTVIGSELVSTVLDYHSTDWITLLGNVTNYLFKCGEPEQTNRAGIHIHVCSPYNLDILKNYVHLLRFSEQVWYYIGGMGYEFRGIRNDCTYCRPLTRYGPPIIPNGSGNPIQMFNLPDLLNSPSRKDFWDRYGGIMESNPPGKYYPIRYGFFTFYPLLTKGTVELRVLNTTLNPEYIRAAIETFRGFCLLSGTSADFRELPENSIYEEHTRDHVLSTFYQLAEMCALTERTKKTISFIISKTPEIKLDPVYVFSHLDRGRFSTNYQDYNPKRLSITDRTKRPNFVDIHTLGR